MIIVHHDNGSEDGNSVRRSDPKLPLSVLKQHIDFIFRESFVGNLPNRQPRLCDPSGAGVAERSAKASATHALPAKDRDLSLIPSVQAIRRTKPKATVARGHDRENASAGEASLD